VEWEVALQHITTTARRVGRAWATAVVAPAPEVDVLTGACAPGDVATVLEAVESAVEALGGVPTGEPVDVVLETVTATVVPLCARLGESGTLVALFRPEEQRLRDLDDRELLISFADHAALALDRAMAVDDREKLAVLSDRERIARDLHDVVIQRLFAVGMQLQAASLRGGDDVRDRLESAVRDIDGTIRDVRATIFELQTQGSDTLRGDLQALGREYVTVLGFSPTVRTSGPVDTAVPEVLREQLLPVLREALSNVARHAHASRVEVEVAVSQGELTLVVIDDGVGMTPHADESGLRNARERAHALGGSLTLADGDPRGLVLLWRVPLLPGGDQD
jgi:signal transduction histidine kinase